MMDRVKAVLNFVYTIAELGLVDINRYWDICDDDLAEKLACKHENGLFE